MNNPPVVGHWSEEGSGIEGWIGFLNRYDYASPEMIEWLKARLLTVAALAPAADGEPK